MKYWTQQLNFAVLCATEGCGISREIFGSGVSLTPQLRAFYQFHVYFTVRRILYQLGGIQSISALPGDPTFNQFSNHYDVASYKRICAEFGLIRRAISASHMAKTTASATFTSMCKVRKKQILNIQGIINSVMKAVKRSKEI